MLAIRKNGYEILQYSLCEGWVNNLYDGSNCPYIFETLEAAVKELQEEFADWQAEINAGDREKDEGYDINEFQILCNSTGVMYILDLIDGKVIATDGFSYH